MRIGGSASSAIASVVDSNIEQVNMQVAIKVLKSQMEMEQQLVTELIDPSQYEGISGYDSAGRPVTGSPSTIDVRA